MIEKPVQMPVRRKLYYALLSVLFAFLTWVALLLPLRSQLRPALPLPGQVATQDYRAPQAATYTSLVLTDLKRAEAANAVAPVYTAQDTNIARQQSESLRAALAYMTTVRADPHGSIAQKLDDLAGMDNLQLNQETAARLLSLAESRWQAVEQGAALTLERVMSSTIQPETLILAREQVPNLVSLALSPDEAGIAAEIAAGFIAPNSFFSAALTESARQAAAQAVEPVSRTYIAGQTVVQLGQLLTAADIEALQQLRLVAAPLGWQDLASAAALASLVTLFLVLYFMRERSMLGKPRRLAMLAGLFMLFLFAARWVIPYHVVIPYAFPLAAYSLTIAALLGMEITIVTTLPLAFLAAFGLSNALDLIPFFLLGGLMGVLALGHARRLASFFWAGLVIAGSGILAVLAYRLSLPTTDWVGLATLGGAAIFNGLASASLAVLMQFFLALLLGLTTPMHLMDLSRPDHPLLQRILRETPGTYQHSLQVANLAEQAAEQIGADTLLTRVGALYHDVGKTANPLFFIENQMPGATNPHNELAPHDSARYIIRHVADGLELGRKYRLPRRVLEFIGEHHGTTLARYQYVRAVQAEGGDEAKVNKVDFRYPGPRPQSRETAILMLADGSEARVRAEKPRDDDEIRRLVKAVLDERIAAGQLEDTRMTLQDLNRVYESLVATLRGMYHPRIIYPSLESTTPDEKTRPTPQSGIVQMERMGTSDPPTPMAPSSTPTAAATALPDNPLQPTPAVNSKE
jgi:cyclic-di-AMP phosphodiesterase PgpH